MWPSNFLLVLPYARKSLYMLMNPMSDDIGLKLYLFIVHVESLLRPRISVITNLHTHLCTSRFSYILFACPL